VERLPTGSGWARSAAAPVAVAASCGRRGDAPYGGGTFSGSTATASGNFSTSSTLRLATLMRCGR
jgi:hypothetical protein